MQNTETMQRRKTSCDTVYLWLCLRGICIRIKETLSRSMRIQGNGTWQQNSGSRQPDKKKETG